MSLSDKINGQRIHDAIRKHNLKLELGSWGVSNYGCYLGVCYYDEFKEFVSSHNRTSVEKWLDKNYAFLCGFNANTVNNSMSFYKNLLYHRINNRDDVGTLEDFDEGIEEGKRVRREYYGEETETKVSDSTA